MRRLLRWLLNALTVLSLVLCVATTVLWVRSYRCNLDLSWNRGRSPHILHSWGGGIVYEIDTDWPDITRIDSVEYSEPEYHWRMWGFVSAAGRIGQFEGDVLTSTYARWWRVPYWFVVVLLVFAQFPLIRKCAGSRRRKVRIAAHLCPACGYDLRATPERCPECGKIPALKA